MVLGRRFAAFLHSVRTFANRRMPPAATGATAPVALEIRARVIGYRPMRAAWVADCRVRGPGGPLECAARPEAAAEANGVSSHPVRVGVLRAVPLWRGV